MKWWKSEKLRKRFHRHKWYVIEKGGYGEGTYYYHERCDCGKEREVNSFYVY